ncbi:MAG: CPBP family intramembrane metalloprotease [Bacteroidales bacterium]|nr:CPBP family intramembrane metalloprotease [Bacteroidales bacterium]
MIFLLLPAQNMAKSELAGMKKIFTYFVDFHKTYFQAKLYLLALLFIALLVTFNYLLDFEDHYIDTLPKNLRVFCYFLYNCVAYYGILLIIWVFGKEKLKLTRNFWIKSLLGFLILGIDNSYVSWYGVIREIAPAATVTFYNKLVVNSVGLLTMFFPLLIVKQIFDRGDHQGLYGLTFSKVDWKPYWIMLLVMVPLIYAATYLPDFLDYYPTYKRTGGDRFAEYYNISENWAITWYEAFYIGDFLFTELFFRGFLIIGMAKLLGKNAVLPMVAAYCMLHFGKPLGEAISSIFGGYILGIIALYSRNIWGGVFVHGGIAGLMELFAFWRMN